MSRRVPGKQATYTVGSGIGAWLCFVQQMREMGDPRAWDLT